MNVVINGTTGITTPFTATGEMIYSGVSSPSLFQNENRIINGSFDFWQRGTSSSSGGYVAADRWINVIGGGTVTMSRQGFTVGDTLGSNNGYGFLRQSVSGQSLSSHNAQIQQRIEGVRTFAGQTITVLGWIRRSSGVGNVSLEAFQSFGTGGSPSADTQGVGQIISLTSDWQPFAVVINIPSISGKVIGTNGDDYLGVVFWTSAGSNFDTRTNFLGLQTIGVDFWGIHTRIGSHTTAAVNLYRQPELGLELDRCQRFYEAGETSYIGTSVVNRYLYVPFRVTKRRAVGVARLSNGPITGGTAGTLIFGQNTHGFYWYMPNTTNAIGGDWSADAEL